MYQSPFNTTYEDLLKLAVEALDRTKMNNSPGHPEDLVAHLVPALEAVAVGYTEGYRAGREHGRSEERKP